VICNEGDYMNQEHIQKILNFTIGLLQWTYGLAAIIVGADKFFHFLVNWHKYLSPLISAVLPYTITEQMYAIGIIEIIAGVIVLSRFTRFGAYLIALWFFVVIADLIILNDFYDIILRDFVIAVGAIALGNLITLRERIRRSAT
jgi:hypothetical protein